MNPLLTFGLLIGAGYFALLKLTGKQTPEKLTHNIAQFAAIQNQRIDAASVLRGFLRLPPEQYKDARDYCNTWMTFIKAIGYSTRDGTDPQVQAIFKQYETRLKYLIGRTSGIFAHPDFKSFQGIMIPT